MYKNNLKQILKSRNISQNKLAEGTEISRQTIGKIVNDEFYNISNDVLTAILIYLEINYYDLGTVYSKEMYLQEKSVYMGFSKQNLEILNDILAREVGWQFTYHPYTSNKCLNLDSKKFSKKFSFSGNIRISSSFDGVALEIVDFDLFKIKNNSDFIEFYALYKSFIKALEEYATKIGFIKIIYNINPYIDPAIKKS